MADLGQLRSEIQSLPAEVRPAMQRIAQILVKMRFGHPTGDAADPCVNIDGGFFSGTTAATPGDEFTIAHGFGRVPYLAVPVLPLDVEGAQLVPLTVSRVADNKRLYFTSTVASAPFVVMVEG